MDIGGPHSASLGVLAFESATKRNRPQVSVGDVVYARVSLADKNLEPELECFNSNQKSDGFGILTGGFIFSCSPIHCRKLIASDAPILQVLGSRFPYETAVGVNGFVWIKSNDVATTLFIAHAIQTSEHLNREQCQQLVYEMSKIQ